MTALELAADDCYGQWADAMVPRGHQIGKMIERLARDAYRAGFAAGYDAGNEDAMSDKVTPIRGRPVRGHSGG